MSIGIELAGQGDHLPPNVFLRALSYFMELVRDVDSSVSNRATGSVRWEISKLSKNSPAQFAIDGKSRLRQGDFTTTIQYSVVNGVYVLNERPEQPEFYSYSALQNLRNLTIQAGKLSVVQIFDDSQHIEITTKVRNNVEYLIGSGSTSLGSVRGTLDAITVHSGNEFRIWPTKGLKSKPVACRFRKNDLPKVIKHIKGEVEVFGRLRRNPKGIPVFMAVHDFVPLEPPTYSPTIEEMSGLVKDLYGGGTLQEYLKEIRNG
jgi:hypothetical protein